MIEMILPLWAATAFPNALKIYCHPKKTDSAGQNKEKEGIIVILTQNAKAFQFISDVHSVEIVRFFYHSDLT